MNNPERFITAHRKAPHILIVRTDRLGEFLLSLYPIKLVKDNYPHSKLTLLARRENIEIIKSVDFVDEFFVWDDRFYSDNLVGLLRFVKFLRKIRVSMVIFLHPKRIFHQAAWFARIPVRVGYRKKWGRLLTHSLPDRKWQALKHEVNYSLDLVKLVCESWYVPSLCIPVPSSFYRNKEKLPPFQKYVFVHPFTSNDAKKLKSRQWNVLIELLRRHYREELVIIGNYDEISESKEYEVGHVHNLVGKLSLGELAFLLKNNCSVFMGLDSGPMHLASILQIPVVAIFTVSSWVRWGPFQTRSLVIQYDKTTDFTEHVHVIINFCKQFLTRK